MKVKNYRFLIPVVLGVLLIGGVIAFWPTQQANAQCGSQASSCKNCHEVQGEYPVNSDGTSWHQAHAFGDFCYICHAGNSQATDKDAAHAGMVPPLSDIQAACQQCHVEDLEERAQVYADELGVEIGSGGAASTSSDSGDAGGAGAAPASAGSAAVVAPPADTTISIDDPNVVDYVQRYDEMVLGKHPINVGNAILIGLIILLVIGGGAYVLYNEKWISVTTEPLVPVSDEYPQEVVGLLPALQKLGKKGRAGLKTLLQDPSTADELLGAFRRYFSKGDE